MHNCQHWEKNELTLSPFWLVFFAVMVQSVAAMTTLALVFLSDTVDRSLASPALRPFPFNRNLRETGPSR